MGHVLTMWETAVDTCPQLVIYKQNEGFVEH